MKDEEPPSVVREGRLYVRGVEEPFTRDTVRTIYFDVLGLELHRSFESSDGKTTPRIRFTGKVELEKDTIGIAGKKEETRELSFTCFPCDPNEPDYEWNIMFGFIEADWEIGNDDDWFCQCYIPQAIFDELVVTYKDGRANALKVGCKTNMWAAEGATYMPISMNVDWKLAPEKWSPGVGTGKINQFSWQISSKRIEPPKKLDPFAMGQAFAEETIRIAQAETQPSPPQPIPNKLSKIGWIIAGVVFVVLWLLFKN